jgi:hypothetical protein
MHRVLDVLLVHQNAATLAPVLAWWNRTAPSSTLLLAHGGTAADFEALPVPDKIHVADARLRTRDHQRDKQGYTRLWREVAAWPRFRDHSHILFMEYDHLPLHARFREEWLARMEETGADVLGHHVQRIDGTSHPHALYHEADPRFTSFWKSLSVRPDPSVVLSMFGSGSLWTREAFASVAAVAEPFPVYLEIWLPTVAHHLGYRVVDLHAQNRWVRNLGDGLSWINQARAAGAWTVHPVKNIVLADA